MQFNNCHYMVDCPGQEPVCLNVSAHIKQWKDTEQLGKMFYCKKHLQTCVDMYEIITRKKYLKWNSWTLYINFNINMKILTKKLSSCHGCQHSVLNSYWIVFSQYSLQKFVSLCWGSLGWRLRVVRPVCMVREIFRDYEFQHLVHIWGRVLENLLEEDQVQQCINAICSATNKN